MFLGELKSEEFAYVVADTSTCISKTQQCKGNREVHKWTKIQQPFQLKVLTYLTVST